jgi:hypothetical protein
MSTEVDIVERLPQIAGRCSFEQDRIDIIAATNLITKLRAERDAMSKIYHLMASSRLEWRRIAEAAPRDMRERAAVLVENFVYRGPFSGKDQIARAIRALPTSVIATEGNCHD